MAKKTTAVAAEGTKSVAELSAALMGQVAPKADTKVVPAGKEFSTRATWTGTVTFGLMSFGVKMMTGQKADRVSLNRLHGKCSSKVNQKNFCPCCNEEVQFADLVSGYANADGSFVVLTKEEVEECLIESTETLELEKFVKASDLDAIQIESTDYLVPDGGKKGNPVSEKLYFLLLETMKQTGKVAIARFAQRGNESVVAVRPLADGSALAVSYLFYDADVRMINLPTAPVLSDGEKQIATQLIDALTGTFNYAEYADKKVSALRSLVASKQAGQTPTKKTAKKAPAAPAGDLMSVLAASVAAAKSKKK